jgi:hypothetical protein
MVCAEIELVDKCRRGALSVYTLGISKVKAGCEHDFVLAWTEMANNTKSDFAPHTMEVAATIE